jgi:Predicted signal transduction protein with a C-terminal ATPase domain
MKIVRSHFTNKISLQRKLIRLFLVTLTIPVIFISFYSYYNISKTLGKNIEELTVNNLKQTSNSLDIWLESYEDVLYQIYTDDDVVALVDKLNQGEEVPVSINQLRRFLRGILNTKEYIRSITIITSNGMVITYDQLTPVSGKNSWIGNFSLNQDELYNKVSSDNLLHVFPTEYGANFDNKDYYLFHLAHRIIDYKNLNKKNGIVIVSIDEKFLRNVCLTKDDTKQDLDNFNFIVDQNGRVISYVDQSKLTKKVTDPTASVKGRLESYLNFVSEKFLSQKKYLSVFLYRNKNLSWDIVNVTNQWNMISQMNFQKGIIILIGFLSLLVAIILTAWMSRALVLSIKKVVSTMHVASSGDLDTRVEVEKKMPLEVEYIALQFNEMLRKLNISMKKEKEAGERQQAAEIKALEAQINPHFLYNTLDTINWMAIDKDEFDISNAISSLATILRYAITNSNGMVEVHTELEWLKDYIYLQQIRLKNTFRYEVDVDPELLDSKIHKLLLQPFVENAIIHGFDGMNREHILKIKFEPKDEFIRITIRDNGKGIEPSLVESINKKLFYNLDGGGHIGMENVIMRLNMYYGEEASVGVNSVLGEGTEFIILIPRRK